MKIAQPGRRTEVFTVSFQLMINSIVLNNLSKVDIQTANVYANRNRRNDWTSADLLSIFSMVFHIMYICQFTRKLLNMNIEDIMVILVSGN